MHLHHCILLVIALLHCLMHLTPAANVQRQSSGNDAWQWKPNSWLEEDQSTAKPSPQSTENLDWASDEDIDSEKVKTLRERNLNLTFQLHHEISQRQALLEDNTKLKHDNSELRGDIKILKHKLTVTCVDKKIQTYENEIKKLNLEHTVLNRSLHDIKLKLNLTLDTTNTTLWQLFQLGKHLKNKEYYPEAEYLLQRLLQLQQNLYGADSLVAGESQHFYAFVLFLLGKFDKSVELYTDLLERRRRVLGEDNLDTLQTMGNLATILGRQGNFARSVQLNTIVLEKKTKLVGEDSPETLATMQNLALFLGYIGKYNESIAMHRKVIAANTRILGEKHAETLRSVNNLALLLSNHGHLDEALEMLLKNIEDKKEVLGENHRDTLISTNNLAMVYFKQGKLEQAVSMFRHVYDKEKANLGSSHPETLVTLTNLNDALNKLTEQRLKEMKV